MADAPFHTNLDPSRDALFREVYDRLKAMAGRQRARAGSPATLVTTELVHELYLRMCDANANEFMQSEQFFAYASRAMRHLLVDLARHRLQLKSGGDQLRISLTDRAVDGLLVDPSQAIELDSALRALEADDPRAGNVVELHYFGGISLEQVAQVTGLAPRTVDRDWAYAKRFLAAYLAR
jgi:RNA polymerase sigma factor (TIGR02999 family)